MPICPNCKTEQTRRVNGTCPACHTPVESYGGYWYRVGTGSPAVAILRYFEKKVSDALSEKSKDRVSFSISRIDVRYRRELVSAERMLKAAEWDIDLVFKAIDLLFTHSAFKWKTRNTLMYIDVDYTAALAIVRANVRAEKARQAEEREAVAKVLLREDVF